MSKDNKSEKHLGRYRKIYLKIWADQKFRTLSKPQPCGQFLWFYLLTNPRTTSLPGLFCGGEVALADELDWDLEGFREAFREASAKAMVKADWKAKIVWVPGAIEYNTPESPNVIIGWGKEWELIPDCALKTEAYYSLKSAVSTLSKAFVEAFNKALPKPFESLPESLSKGFTKGFGEPVAVAVAVIKKNETKKNDEILAPNRAASSTLLIDFENTDKKLDEDVSGSHQIIDSRPVKQENDVYVPPTTEAPLKSPEIKDLDISKKPESAVKNMGNLDMFIICVFNFWQDKLNHPRAKLDKKTKAIICSALTGWGNKASAYSVKDCQDAIVGCSKTPFNMGKNDRNTKYDGLHIILDPTKIAGFIERSSINAGSMAPHSPQHEKDMQRQKEESRIRFEENQKKEITRLKEKYPEEFEPYGLLDHLGLNAARQREERDRL